MPSASAIFVFAMRIVIPLNPCFVLCLSRSHKSPVGGKEEKVLIYNEKELNKIVDIIYPALRDQTGRHSVSYWYLSETTRLAAMPWCPLKSANRRSEDKGWPPGMAARGESRQR
ncbi:MAG: hypothetical protein E7K70_21995, partial [Klebsiella sp.]